MTSSSEMFCLKWNDFQNNIISSYHDLRKQLDFCDVTLVCEEGQQIQAHRIILTPCSPFFSTVLKRNKHHHPLIYMKGVKVKDLVAIMDFIYHGEAKIYQQDLDGFLALAEELKLTGLAGDQNNMLDYGSMEPVVSPRDIKTKTKTTTRQEALHYPFPTPEEYDTTAIFEDHPSVHVDAGGLLIPVDTKNEDITAQLDSMMTKAEDG